MNDDELFRFVTELINWDIFWPVFLAVAVVAFVSRGAVDKMLRIHLSLQMMELRELLEELGGFIEHHRSEQKENIYDVLESLLVEHRQALKEEAKK